MQLSKVLCGDWYGEAGPLKLRLAAHGHGCASPLPSMFSMTSTPSLSDADKRNYGVVGCRSRSPGLLEPGAIGLFYDSRQKLLGLWQVQ